MTIEIVEFTLLKVADVSIVMSSHVNVYQRVYINKYIDIHFKYTGYHKHMRLS